MKISKLEKLDACSDALTYVKSRKFAEDAWMNCERGDWMMWIAAKVGVDDRKLMLAKATILKQVEHLLKNKRIIDAMDACFRYANGEITREKLNVFASALDPYQFTYAIAAMAVVYASTSTEYNSANSVVYVAHAISSYTGNGTLKSSLKKSADICRDILTEEVLLKYKKIR